MSSSTKKDEIGVSPSCASFEQNQVIIQKDCDQSKSNNQKRSIGWLWLTACGYGSIPMNPITNDCYHHSASYIHYMFVLIAGFAMSLRLHCDYWLYWSLLLCALLPQASALPRLEAHAGTNEWFKIVHVNTGDWYAENSGIIQTYSGDIESDDKLWKAIHINGIYFRLQNKLSSAYLKNPASSSDTITGDYGTTSDESLWYMVASVGGTFRLKNTKTRRVFGYSGTGNTPYTALYSPADAATLLYFDYGHGAGNANNELCNTNEWNEIFGSWTQDGSTCALTNWSPGVAAKVWFGSANGITPNPLYADLSFKLRVVFEIISGNDAGIMIRTAGVEGVLDAGPNYFIGLNPDLDTMLFGRQDDGWSLVLNPSVTNDPVEVYDLTVIASGEYCDVYLNDTLIINGISASNWQTGSIGLRSQSTVTTYHKVVYEPRGTNLLCDDTKWNGIAGTWDFVAGTCVLSNTAPQTPATMWFGSADGLTADNDYGGTAFVVKASFEIISGTAGLIFDCVNATTDLNAEQFYLVEMNPAVDTVSVAIRALAANGGSTVLTSAWHTIDYNQVYELTLIVNGVYVDVWIDDAFLLSDVWLQYAPVWDHGSIGFRSYSATTNIYSISMDVFQTVAPTRSPTLPTGQPTKYPTKYPSKYPTKYPSKTPTDNPTNYPSKTPTRDPTKYPTNDPSKTPTNLPSTSPTKYPSKPPTNIPSKTPTKNPTKFPTNDPSKTPTNLPSTSPTNYPSKPPTNNPTKYPTNNPTKFPTNYPTKYPTNFPTETPTVIPTVSPSFIPTESPSFVPTISPTFHPTVEGGAEWIRKESLNCPDGFIDVDQSNPYFEAYCQRCPEGSAGTYGQCDQCGTLEEPNHSRTGCDFVHPWWLYLIEVITGFGFAMGIVSCLYKKVRAKQKGKPTEKEGLENELTVTTKTND